MKADTHPSDYRMVIFHDNTSGERFLISSTVKTTDKAQWTDGKEYPVFFVEISSASHPFYTGKQKLIDVEGRVERFQKRYASFNKSKT
jgi:large subunit ribosomal protein L31